MAENIDPEIVIAKVQANYDLIEDYSVTARVKVDIPNLRMPRKKIKFYYKKPDKLITKTNGFAIVPKSGMFPVPTTFLSDSTEVKWTREDTLNNSKCYILECGYSFDKDTLSNFFLWINTSRWTIDKITTNESGIKGSSMIFSYVNLDGFWIPEATDLYINFKKGLPDASRPSIKYPFGFMSFGKQFEEDKLHGEVKIMFSDYKINSGLKDSFFNNQK